MKNFNIILCIGLLFLPCFQAQGSARTFSKPAGIFTRKQIAIAGTAGLIAAGVYKFQATQKSYTPSPQYLAKQEQLDKEHEDRYKEEQFHKLFLKYKNVDTLEKEYPYAYRWFKEFKKDNPYAGFSQKIKFGFEYNPSYAADWGAYVNHNVITCNLGYLERLNAICQIKYEDPESLYLEYLKAQKFLDLAEGSLLHEVGHLRPDIHYKRILQKDSSRHDDHAEETAADENAAIHASIAQTKALIDELKSHLMNIQTFLPSGEIASQKELEKLEKLEKNAWFSWKQKIYARKINVIIEKMKEYHLENDTTHPFLTDRIKTFEEILKEKEALEERLARETPEENEENLRKLLERGPRNRALQ